MIKSCRGREDTEKWNFVTDPPWSDDHRTGPRTAEEQRLIAFFDYFIRHGCRTAVLSEVLSTI